MRGRWAISTSIKRIVIVDDHEAVRRGVRELVERPDRVIVGEAADGDTALRLVADEQPDLVILDFSIPALNGVQLTKKIVTQSPKTEILLFTMHDKEDLQMEALRAGARGYVLKSDQADILLQAVQSLLLHRMYFSPSVSQSLLENFCKNAEFPRPVITDREQQVLQLIAEGHTNKQTAAALGISIKTVETHRSAIQNKLNAHSTADIVRYAIRNGIIEA